MNMLKKMAPSFLFIFLNIIGWCSDIITQTYGIAFIYVEAGYLGDVFAATCTVAVLGNALLSLLIGASDRKIMGISIQTVFSKTCTGGYMLQSIILPLLSIILAIVAFAFECYTSLTILLVYDVAVIIWASMLIWATLSAKRKQELLVSEIINNSTANECDKYIDNWFSELHKAISVKDQSGIDQHVNSIKTIIGNVPEENAFANCIERQLPSLFTKTCEAFGFTYGYEFVAQINKMRQYGYIDLERLALDYINQIKFSEASRIAIRDMRTTVKNILESNIVESDTKWSIVYNLFCSINDNAYLSVDEKKEFLGSFLSYLCTLRDGDYEESKIDIILSVFRNKVLLEGNSQKREWLHLLLVEQLLLRNQLNHDICYIQTIAEMFRALFFFVYYETETLSVTHRKSLQSLYTLTTEEKDIVRVSFATLIINNQADIVSWLAEDSVSFSWRKGVKWDYFPKLSPSKRIIWDKTNVLRFAYCYYKWIGYAKAGHPFVAIIQGNRLSNDAKEEICRELSNLFDSHGLSSEALHIIEYLEDLVGVSHNYVNCYNPSEQAFFQDELIKVIKSRNANAIGQSENTNENMIQLVQNILKDYKCLCINQQSGGPRYTRRRLPPMLVEKSTHQAKSAADRIAYITQQTINNVISRRLSQVDVQFNMDGINTLLHNLENEKYQYRNYTYVDDLAFTSDVIGSEEYQKLKQAIENIPKDHKSAFSSYVFLKVPKLEYSLDIHYHTTEPSELQCEEYVRAHELAEGYYQINGNKFDFAHAMRYVREEFVLELCDLYVWVGVEKDTGFIINFRRT